VAAAAAAAAGVATHLIVLVGEVAHHNVMGPAAHRSGAQAQSHLLRVQRQHTRRHGCRQVAS
jgi:hypothetical protein